MLTDPWTDIGLVGCLTKQEVFDGSSPRRACLPADEPPIPSLSRQAASAVRFKARHTRAILELHQLRHRSPDTFATLEDVQHLCDEIKFFETPARTEKEAHPNLEYVLLGLAYIEQIRETQ